MGGYPIVPFGFNASYGQGNFLLPTENMQLHVDMQNESSYTLSGSDITAFHDLSGNGRDFTLNAGGNEAVLSSDSDFGNNNVADFLGLSDNWYQSNSQTLSPPFTLYIVGKFDGNNMALFGSHSSSQIFKFSKSSGGNFNLNNGTSLQRSGDNLAHYWTCQSLASGSNDFIRANGSQIGSSGSAGSDNCSVFRFGTDDDGDANNNFNGRIAEVILYTAQHSLSTIEDVESYLASKWGF